MTNYFVNAFAMSTRFMKVRGLVSVVIEDNQNALSAMLNKTEILTLIGELDTILLGIQRTMDADHIIALIMDRDLCHSEALTDNLEFDGWVRRRTLARYEFTAASKALKRFNVSDRGL